MTGAKGAWRRRGVAGGAALRGRLRAAVSGRALPPGDASPLEELERGDRRLLLRRFAEHGPVFRAGADDGMWVCVLGLERCRRFVRENPGAMRADSIRVESLFPKGFLRMLEGEDHRAARRALVSAIDADALFADPAPLEEIARAAIAGYAGEAQDGDDAPRAWHAALTAASSGMLAHLFFDAPPGSDRHAALIEGYRRLGPFGIVWNVGPRQAEAFGRLRDMLREIAEQGEASPAILHAAARARTLDETLMGNFVYMVEMGRYDMAGLFRWLSRYLALHPDLADRIAAEWADAPAGPRPLAEAFVQETLRLDQSERLIRVALRDIAFDGLLVPRGARIRLCMWESHKDPATFPDPFAFDHARFEGAPWTADQYAPFGLDHHRCPLGDVAIRTGALLLGALASGWRVEAAGDGPAVRGAYHWEPAHEFSVRLAAR